MNLLEAILSFKRSENSKSKKEPWKVQFWLRLVQYPNISNRAEAWKYDPPKLFFITRYTLQLVIPGYPLPNSKNTILWNNRMMGIDKVRIRQNGVWVSEKHKLLIIFKSPLLKGFFLWCMLSLTLPFHYYHKHKHPHWGITSLLDFWKRRRPTHPAHGLSRAPPPSGPPCTCRPRNSLLEHHRHFVTARSNPGIPQAEAGAAVAGEEQWGDLTVGDADPQH